MLTAFDSPCDVRWSICALYWSKLPTERLGFDHYVIVLRLLAVGGDVQCSGYLGPQFVVLDSSATDPLYTCTTGVRWVRSCQSWLSRVYYHMNIATHPAADMKLAASVGYSNFPGSSFCTICDLSIVYADVCGLIVRRLKGFGYGSRPTDGIGLVVIDRGCVPSQASHMITCCD